MITLFTTTKDFQGRNRVNQLNAIRSWLAAPCLTEVIIFGRSTGIEELGCHPNLKIVDQVRISDTGAPYGNEMFDIVNRIAKYSICSYVNADILLTDKFFETIHAINKKIKKNYLLVGARIDADVDELIDFSSGWKKKMHDKYTGCFQTHAPVGSDYFVFPKGQYHSGNMPDLLIGRPGWDIWMLFNARKRNFQLVDISFTVLPFHLNHDYSHKPNPNKNIFEDEEALFNMSEIPKGQKLLFILLDACNYYYEDGKLFKKFARNDFNFYEAIERAVNKSNLMFELRIRRDKVQFRISKIIFFKMLCSKNRKSYIEAGEQEYNNRMALTDAIIKSKN